MNTESTIVALATAQGVGAIGIIRMSGADALSICNSCFKGKDLNTVASHTIQYGYIVDGPKIIDEVMVSVFKAPRSFTTEDSIEISFHGSPYIAKEILKTLIKNGAVLAKPGEFTLRAFMNGRIDLTQAEAVADIIASNSQSAHEIAINQMRGGFTEELKALRTQLLNFVSLIELELDFSEEDVEFADRGQLLRLVEAIQVKISPLIESFKYGNVIKNGVPVAIIGKPNSGKSTLLNALLNDNRAIVSDIAGTTRDTIEEILVIDGIEFRFIDTAGIRDTDNSIEQIGVEKAKEKISQSSIIIHLIDSTADYSLEDFESFEREMKSLNPAAELLTVLNKIDQNPSLNPLKKRANDISISAKTQLNISGLKDKLVDIINQNIRDTNQTTITNIRHYQSLLDTQSSLQDVTTALTNKISGEYVSQDIKRALNALGEITGEVTNDEILGNIFGKFCIGK